MGHPSCAECKAIYQELLDLVEISRQAKPGPNATLEQLAGWFDRDEDEDYKMRVRLALSNVKSRLIERLKLTGHNVPRPVPPVAWPAPTGIKASESAIPCWRLPICGLYPTGEVFDSLLAVGSLAADGIAKESFETNAYRSEIIGYDDSYTKRKFLDRIHTVA